MKTLKILGLLLAYPAPKLIDHLDDCESILKVEKLLPKKGLAAVLSFMDELRSEDIYQLQENYVETFDRGRAHSLHLFEHIFGDSRDRGQAMVNLVEAYEEKGLYIDRAELPDYVPLFLEFLSLCPADEALDLLSEPIDVLAMMGTRLKKSGSRYAVLFDAILDLSKTKPNPEKLQAAIEEEVPAMTLEDIDKEWEESAAFGETDNQVDCGSCTVQAGNQQRVTIN